MDSIQQQAQHLLISLQNYEQLLNGDDFNHVNSNVREVLQFEVPFVYVVLTRDVNETGIQRATEFFADCQWAYEHGSLRRQEAGDAA